MAAPSAAARLAASLKRGEFIDISDVCCELSKGLRSAGSEPDQSHSRRRALARAIQERLQRAEADSASGRRPKVRRRRFLEEGLPESATLLGRQLDDEDRAFVLDVLRGEVARDVVQTQDRELEQALAGCFVERR
jgi:ribosomal protein S12 methylthiotransferase accessory factor YcaO